MNNSRIYLDIHALQTLPPSNINRDDTGSPKTAQYGGVRRARVSSQSWKRAMREYFTGKGEEIAIRTKCMAQYVAERIIEKSHKSESEAIEMACEILKFTGLDITKDESETWKSSVLFFLSEAQANCLADIAIAGELDGESFEKARKATEKKTTANKNYLNKIKKRIGDHINLTQQTIDIALFGRMLAENPKLNEDASAQVAHAISTHAVETEFDFYTAVDDLAPEDNAGAGMLGTLEYNSSTLYRYANVAVHELHKQLKDKQAVIDTLKLFVEAFSNSLPTGKINSYANQTLPQVLMITLRRDRPVSLVSAFETPIQSRRGYVHESIEALLNEYHKVQKFTEAPVFTAYVALEDISTEQGLVPAENLRDLGERMAQQLQDLIEA